VIARAINRADLLNVVRFFAPDPFRIFTSTKWSSILDGTLAVVKAVTIANTYLAAITAKYARAYAFRKSAMIYSTFTMEAVIVTEKYFAKGSSKSMRREIRRILNCLSNVEIYMCIYNLMDHHLFVKFFLSNYIYKFMLKIYVKNLYYLYVIFKLKCNIYIIYHFLHL